MYAFIKGTVEYKEDGVLAVDAGGMGYNIRVTEGSYQMIHEGDMVMLYLVHMVSSQDGTQTLYGLLSREEKRMFQLLTSINRIGGKAALAILSVLTLEEISAAVAMGDYKPFTKASGIGKKAAEMIVLELKGKLKDARMTSEEAQMIVSGMDDKQEAVEALVGLGFSEAQAEEAVEAVSVLADNAEELVVLALKRLGM